MGLRFASLGSGSDGNGLVVEAGDTRVLIDCGFTLAETTRRLARLGLRPESLSAVVVTHEHTDHVGGVARLAAKHRLPVWASFGTLTAMQDRFTEIEVLRGVNGDEVFAIGDLQFEPLPVPHDAREPVQFVVSDGARRLAVLTDLGEVTPHVAERVSGCEALVLECNHDPDMLAASDYPYALKCRIAGRYGHLENAAAAALLARIDRSRLVHVVAAHLSQQNNRPELARAALCGVLGCAPEWVAVADAESGFDWRNL
jgi:phosphoribosyl 1,2-cyclic phosphodiesterase